MIHLCIATPDLTEQIHTREKMIHLCIATPALTEQIHTREKMIHLCIATPDMTEEHPGTTLRSQRTCVLPSTVPTGPLQVSVSVSLTVQEVTPLGVANKLMAPGVTERHRPEEGHFHQEVLSPEYDESSKAIAYYSFPVFRLIGEYSFLDLFHSIQRSY